MIVCNLHIGNKKSTHGKWRRDVKNHSGEINDNEEAKKQRIQNQEDSKQTRILSFIFCIITKNQWSRFLVLII